LGIINVTISSVIVRVENFTFLLIWKLDKVVEKYRIFLIQALVLLYYFIVKRFCLVVNG